MSKIDCDGGDVVILMKKAITVITPLAKSDPQKHSELLIFKKALNEYLIDCSICKKGGNDFDCLKESLTKLSRQLPFIRNSIYPWVNYDWDYGNFIDNNYSAKATGSSPDGSKWLKNIGIFLKFLDAYVTAANPNNKSIAGGRDKYSDYPIYGCEGNSKKGCDSRQLVKNRNKQKRPYKSKFFNKSIKGERASSYFARVGSCPRKDIKTSTECINKKFKWVSDPIDKLFDKITGRAAKESGSCHQPRYIYLNNSPGLELKTMKLGGIPSISLGKLKGYIPSVANDIFSMSPDKLMKAYNGESVNGHMVVQECPVIKEKFTSFKTQNFEYTKIISLLTLIFILSILTIFYFAKK
jgi:hypothetical protein